MDGAFDRAAQAAAKLLTEDVDRVMNEFNTRRESRTEEGLQEKKEKSQEKKEKSQERKEKPQERKVQPREDK